ncbi:hypothetical protein JCM5353_002841 [Sporobolomyces roseus]
MTVSLTPKAKIPPYLPDRNNYSATHEGLVHVEFGKEGEEFNSCLKADKAFKAGETICTICNTLSGEKAYSSVQVLPDPPLPTSFTSSSIPQTYYSQSPQPRRHIELNSDLLYVNHSCDPNVVFEVNGREAEKGENDESGEWNGRWRVRAIKDLPVGEILTFAYFSTEWDMDQPFSCLCNTSKCLGTIKGAKDIPSETLDQYFINDHIKAMKAHQAQQTQQGGKASKILNPMSSTTESRSPPQAVKA